MGGAKRGNLLVSQGVYEWGFGCWKMCRVEKKDSFDSEFGKRHHHHHHHHHHMGLKSDLKAAEKVKGSNSMVSRSKMKLWMIRATTTVLLWTCLVQLTALGEMWGPRVLKGWPSCFTPSDSPRPVKDSLPVKATLPTRDSLVPLPVKPAISSLSSSSVVVEKISLPPKSEYSLVLILVICLCC